MANLPVRTTSGQRGRTRVAGEHLRMRAEPFRQVAPLSTGDAEPACFKPDFQIATTQPGDDALARWESEGGTTRDGQAEPRPWAHEVG
jgi:hypothetical protein